MTLKDGLLALFDREVAISKKVLANVPEGKQDFKPHEKSMAFGYLAQLVATMPLWVAMICDKPDLDLAAGNVPRDPWQTGEDLVALHDKVAAQGRASLAGIDEKTLYTDSWALKMKGQVLSSDPKHQVVADTLTHLAHHRGQLTVYLRLLGSKVASTYGPSADDNPWAPPKAAGA